MAAPGTEEELKFYLRFAKPLALNLTDPSDRITASAWIQKLKKEEFGALKTRTDHLKILLFALQKQRLVGRFSKNPSSIEKLEDFSEEIKLQDIAKQLLEAEVTERRKQGQIPPPYYVEYSPDLKEFAASQEIPNFGAHGYYAFSKEPIFLWYKSDKIELPKDVLEFDGDAVHGIHLPLSGGDISRPRLSRSPDKPKPKTISELEKSIAELEGKSGISAEEIVPVIPIGSPSPPEDREPPSWGSNLGSVLEPPEKDISPKEGRKSPAAGDIEGDVLEDELPPSFLDISGVSFEEPSPAVCPFVPSPHQQSSLFQKSLSPRADAICPFSRPLSPHQYSQFEAAGDLLDEEMPPDLLDLSAASSSPVAYLPTGGEQLDDELPPDLLDSGELLSPPKRTNIRQTVEKKTFLQSSPKRETSPALQQPSSVVTPPGARRPPFVRPEMQYRRQAYTGQTPKLSKAERRDKLEKISKKLVFSPYADERPVVQKTTTETIMEDGVPQKTITTVETVKPPEEGYGLEDIEGDEILPGDLDTSIMRDLEKELAEAEVHDVEMLEDEYEGMDKYAEMEKELDEMDAAMNNWDNLLKQLEEENKEDILEIERLEEAERKQKGGKKGKQKIGPPSQLPSPPPTHPSPSPSLPSPYLFPPSPRVPSPSPSPRQTSPCPLPPSTQPSPRLPSPCPLPPPTQPSPCPLPPPIHSSPRLPSPARETAFGVCPTEQRLQEIAGEAGDDLVLDQSLPEFASSFVDDIALSPKKPPTTSPASLPSTSLFMEDFVLDQSAPEFAPSFIDEIPLSPRDVVQTVTHKVITKGGVPQKEITTTTTIPRRIPQRQIPKPRGVITKVIKETVSKNGVPQQQIVTTQTIPQPSTSGISIQSKGSICKLPRPPTSRIPSSRIPSSSAAVKGALERHSATPKLKPPRSFAPVPIRSKLSTSEREQRQEELGKVRRQLDWSADLCRLEDIEGDVLEESQPQLAPSFVDEIPLSPLTEQRLRGVVTSGERPIVQMTTTETIMKNGVPQKTVTTVETVKAPKDQYKLEDIEGDILEQSPPQLVSPGQPCPATITPQGARRPPVLRPETQKYRKQLIAGQTPTLPDDERRGRLAGTVRRIDFGPCPAEQRLQDVAAADERPVVQKTTTETIMEDGIPQKTITTVETVKPPEKEYGLEDIEGDEILPGDLDTSIMRDLEKELAEAEVHDVEMLEDEYEGMDKYAEMGKELDEMDAIINNWDTLLKQLEEENKEDILEIERQEEAERKMKTGKQAKQPSPRLPSPCPLSSPTYPSPSPGLPSPCPLSPRTSPEAVTPTGAALPVFPVERRRVRHVGATPALSGEERRKKYEKAARILDFGVSPADRSLADIEGGEILDTSLIRELQKELAEATVQDVGISEDEYRGIDNLAQRERELNEMDVNNWDAILQRVEEEHVCGTPRTRYSDRTQARDRPKRRIDMSQASPPYERHQRVETFKRTPDGTIKREVKESETDEGPSTSRQNLPPPCESAPHDQPLTEEHRRRLLYGVEYDQYEEYKKHRRTDVPETPPMFSRFRFIRDQGEGTVYEPEQFGIGADEVWQEGAATLRDLALVRSPTGADAQFFEDEAPPELIDQELEYEKDEEEKRDLNRRLGKVMEDIQRIKNELAESAGLPITLPRKSQSPRRPKLSSDFLTSESPPGFDELLPDYEPVSPLEDRQNKIFEEITSQEGYAGLLDESPPPLSPCESPRISPSQVRRILFSPSTTSPPKAISTEVPTSKTTRTTTTSPIPKCPVEVSPARDIDLRRLKRDIRERAVRPTDKPHMDLMLGKTSGKRRRLPKKSPAPEGTFIEKEEDYVTPERIPGWHTPPRLKPKRARSPPRRTREVWDTSYAPPRPAPDAQLDDEGPPEELFFQIVDDYEDGVPVKRTETKVITALPTSPKPISSKIRIRDKHLPAVQGPAIDLEEPPDELFTEIVDEYVDGVPVKRTETKVTTALPQKGLVSQFQPRSPTTIAREEHLALLDVSPPGFVDDEALEAGIEPQEHLQPIVCESPRPSRSTTTRSPGLDSPLSIPSTSAGVPTSSRIYRRSEEGKRVMKEVEQGAKPFKDMKFEWNVISGRTRSAKPKTVKRYGRYRRTYVPELGKVEEFPFCGDGLLEKYSELTGLSQQPLPEDLMGHEVPITSTPVREGRRQIMDEDIPLGLPSPIGQSRLAGWKTPPHLQYERIKFPKKRSSSRQRSPRPGPSTSPGYIKRKQIFVDGSPVRTVETKVSIPSPKGIEDISDIEFPESPPPPDERLQPQLQEIVQREHDMNLLVQSPPQFGDFSFEEGIPAEQQEYWEKLHGVLPEDVCPDILGESPPPFSPEQPSPQMEEYDIGAGSPIRIRKRLFPPADRLSPISNLASVLSPSKGSAAPPQVPTRTPPKRTTACPITSPTSPEIDARRLRRDIRERAVRPTDKPHMDLMLGKTSGKRRRLPKKSPAPEGTFIEKEEEYVTPERIPGWHTPPRLKPKRARSPPRRTREVWDKSYAPPRPAPDAQLDDEGPPEELFFQIVDDYEDGVPVKRTETKVTTALPPSPKPISPKIRIRDKRLPAVQGPAIDLEEPPEELFTEIVDEYVDGVPVKRTETKVTTALSQKGLVSQFQPRSPTTIAREEHLALLDVSPPGFVDDEALEAGIEPQEHLQPIVCESPRPSRSTTTRSPRLDSPLSIPSTSAGVPTSSRIYRRSEEGKRVMKEVEQGAKPFKDMKFEWNVISGRTRSAKPKTVKRYGRYRRTYVPELGKVEEFPFCGDGLLEKYSELTGHSQQPLPEDLMGHEVPITSTPVREGRRQIMDEDIPLGLPSPIGQSRLAGWKTPPHLQYERIKFPKKRSSSRQRSPRPGPSISPGYIKRKQIFVDGSPVRTVETKVSIPSPKGIEDISDIEFPESPPPPDERLQPQLQEIVQREHDMNLLEQSPPQFGDFSFEEGIPAEQQEYWEKLHGVLPEDVCPGILGESPPPFSPEQPSPQMEEYDIGAGSPIRIRRRLFPIVSPPLTTPTCTAAAARHPSPVRPTTNLPPSPEIDPRQLRREIREKATRPSDKHHVDLVLGKTFGKRRRIHKQSPRPDGRFIEREEDDVPEAGVPGWKTPPRLIREKLQPLKVPQFDLWSDYGERSQKSSKPPVVTEITEEMVDGVHVRRTETTVQHSPVSGIQLCEESPPAFIQSPPLRSPPEFHSMVQPTQQYSPLSEMSPPAFIASPPIRSPRQIPLPNVYQDTAGILDTSAPELVCSPTGPPRRSPTQIPLPNLYQDRESIMDTSQPELIYRSPPKQRTDTPRSSPRQISPIQIEGAHGIESTSHHRIRSPPQDSGIRIGTTRRPSRSGEVCPLPVQMPTYRTSRGDRIVMSPWPDLGTPSRSEYSTDIAFGGRSSPGILDTSPISDIGSDEECDFTWMG